MNLELDLGIESSQRARKHFNDFATASSSSTSSSLTPTARISVPPWRLDETLAQTG